MERRMLVAVAGGLVSVLTGCVTDAPRRTTTDLPVRDDTVALRDSTVAAPGGGQATEQQKPGKPADEAAAPQTIEQSYTNGISLKLSLSAKAVLVNRVPIEKRTTGLELDAGDVTVVADHVPPLVPDEQDNLAPDKSAPRFWRLLRRRRVSIGTTASNTAFHVTSENGASGKFTTIKTLGGNDLEIESDDGNSYTLKDSTKHIVVYETGAKETKFILMPDDIEVGKPAPKAGQGKK